MDVLEKTFMKSKNEYPDGFSIQRKSYLAYAQLFIFNHYLSQKGNSLERIIEAFIFNYLNSRFDIQNIRFTFPSKSSSYFEKIRVSAPEFEFLLKQYQNYVDEGKIDFELLQFSSSPLIFCEIKSLVDRKYIYSNDIKITYLKNVFFSDQSLLSYIEPYNDKYHNFYDLLTSENVEFKLLESFQKDIVSRLVDDEYLNIDKDGFVRISKQITFSIVADLFSNEVLNYWYYPEEMRKVIDGMVDANLLISKSTLFSEQEINYFNFYLNKKEFTNGFDLRNKYLHATNPTSEKEHEREYFILLQFIILVLLKIEGDLVVGDKCIA